MYSEEELIEELQRVSEEHCDGETPMLKDIQEHSDITSYQIYKNFDGMEHFLYDAGLISEYTSSIDEEKYYSEVKKVSNGHCDGEAPTWQEMETHANINPETISKKLGRSWVEILDELQFEHERNEKEGRKVWSKEEFIEKVENTLSEINPPLHSSKVSEKMESFPSFRSRWNMGWRDVLEECGVCQEEMPRQILTEAEKKERLDEKLEKYIQECSGVPYRGDFERKYGNSAWINKFYDGWKDALPEDAMKQKLIEELRKRPSENEVPSRETFNETSDFSCYHISEYFDGWIKGLEEAGVGVEKAKKHDRDYSREDIIEILQRVSEDQSNGGCGVTQQELSESPVSLQSETVCRYFGSWNEALREAGLLVNQGREYTRKELIEEIQRVSEEHCNNETPTVNDVNKYSYYNSGNIKEEFGTFNNGVIEAGFTPNRRKRNYEVSREELIMQIDEKFQRFPNYKLYKRHECSLDEALLQSFFTNWKNFMEENIIDQKWEEYHKNVFLNDVERVRAALDQDSIFLRDYKHFEDTHHSYGKVYRLFEDGWETVLDKLGLEQKAIEHVSGEEHHWYKHGESRDIDYGSSWNDRLKKDIRGRDGWRCRVCGKSNAENKSETGHQLNVHHIKPHWKWAAEEHEEMNSPNNLISLCNSCHGRVEGKWQNCDPQEFERRAKELLGYTESFEERTLFAY
jgi:hypothetical protein